MRNKEVETSLLNLTYAMGYYENRSSEIKKITDYIDRLERENFGLRQKVSNMREKEEARCREMGWRR